MTRELANSEQFIGPTYSSKQVCVSTWKTIKSQKKLQNQQRNSIIFSQGGDPPPHTQGINGLHLLQLSDFLFIMKILKKLSTKIFNSPLFLSKTQKILCFCIIFKVNHIFSLENQFLNSFSSLLMYIIYV